MDQHQAGDGPANNTMAKTLINSATLYSVEFPEGCALADCLSQPGEAKFHEPFAVEWSSTGFVPVPGTEEFVLTLPGVARVFAVKLADKILPASVITNELNKRIADIELTQERRVGKKERGEIKDTVTDELLFKALVKYKTVLVFHHLDSGLLVIPSTSASVCDRIMKKLNHAVGTMRTTTIHVSGLTDGLTTRMLAWAQAEDLSTQQPMGDEFDLAGDITLTGELGKAKFSITDLASAQKGVREAMELAGMQVAEIGLQCADADYSFRLSSNFKFKGIDAGVEIGDLDDEIEAFTAQVFAELVPLVGVSQKLAALFGFADDGGQGEGGDSDKVEVE